MKREKIRYENPEVQVLAHAENVITTSGDIYNADKIEGEEGGIIDVDF